jgi:hypothetical protein
MATNKPQVLAYLHTVVYERLAEFKQEHGIRSLSQAVEIVLSDYFGVAVPGIALPVALLSSRSHIDKGESPLEKKVAVLAEKYEFLYEAIALPCCKQQRALIQKNTNLPADVTLSCHVEKSKEIRNLQVRHSSSENNQVSNGSVLASEKLPISLSEEWLKKGLTGVALAERLNSYSSLISYKRSKPNFSFWTQEKDPDSIAWEYRSRTRRFHPVEVSW